VPLRACCIQDVLENMSPLSGALGLRSSTKHICVFMGTWTPVCGDVA